MNARLQHDSLSCCRVFSDGLMKLVHVAYKARKQCIHAALSPGRQSHYVCVQLCDKAGALLRDLLLRADNSGLSTALTKVSLSCLFLQQC